MLAECKTLTVSIARGADEVYAFVANPENLPRWAKAFCQAVRKSGSEWVITTPVGEMKVRFAERNAFRVADHYVTAAPGVEIYVPMRVLPNGREGSEVVFTLFRQRDMSDAKFREDMDLVQRDLAELKRVLEGA